MIKVDIHYTELFSRMGDNDHETLLFHPAPSTATALQDLALIQYYTARKSFFSNQLFQLLFLHH